LAHVNPRIPVPPRLATGKADADESWLAMDRLVDRPERH
jgi:hypothetical protein